MRPIVHHRGHVSAIVFGEVHPARASVPRGEFLTRLSHGRRVDQRCDFFDVIHDHAMVQRFVPIVQVFQHDVLPYVALLRSQCDHEPLLLQVYVHDPVGEQSAEPQPVPFPRFECRALIEERVRQYIRPPHRNAQRRLELPRATGPFARIGDGFRREGRILLLLLLLLSSLLVTTHDFVIIIIAFFGSGHCAIPTG